ncbi:MAG: polyprenyl synthetase family protein, partial [Candidatus Eisenbacteria bacterium]
MSAPLPSERDLTSGRTFDDLFSRGRLGVVTEDYGRVEKMLAESVDASFDLVPAVIRHLTEAGGKRIRPIVHCLAARLSGYEGDEHIVLAAVSEIIHSATLLHDDVIDEGKVRRGRPTANRIWGNEVPVLVGDFIFARAFTIMMDRGHYRIASRLAKTVEDLVQGELLQLTHAGDPLLGREVYEEIIRCKTASLFSWCGRAAAMISGLGDGPADELASFGHHFGIAFQITDDVLDYVGASRDTGKGETSDLAEGKMTLPLILAMEKDAALAADVRRLLDGSKGAGDPVGRIAASVARNGAIEDSVRIAEDH